MNKISEAQLRTLRWWLRHYKRAGHDFILIVEKAMTGDESSLRMLKAHLPAYKETFMGKLYGDVEDDEKE